MIVTSKYLKQHPDIKPEATLQHEDAHGNIKKYHIIEAPYDPEEYEAFMEDYKTNDSMKGKFIRFKNGKVTIKPTRCIPDNPGIKDDSSKRDIMYIFGPSECGKTTTCTIYARHYRKMYPHNNIMIFTPNVPIDKPGSLLELDPLVFDLSRPEVGYNNFVANPIQPSELADSLVIFDDLEGFDDKKTLDGIEKLMNNLLTNGRHYRTSILFCKHVAAGGKKTQTSFTETDYIVTFPFKERPKKLSYVLDKYGGMSVKEREFVAHPHNRTRPLFISTKGTPFVVGDQYIWIRDTN